MAPRRFESRSAILAFAAGGFLAAAIVPPQPSLAQTIEFSPFRGSLGGGSDALGAIGSAEASRSAASGDPRDSGAANYGAPRPKLRLPKPYPPRRRPSPPPFSPRHPLPPLEPYRSSWQARGATHLRPSLDAAPPPPPTVAATPTTKAKPKPKVETKPFDPVGLEVGSLRLLPFVETGYGYDSNPNRLSTGAAGSRLVRADAGLKVQSDWARHDFRADLRLGYAKYFDAPDADRPDGTGAFVGRVDVTRDAAINIRGRFDLDTLRPGAPALSSGLPNVTVTNRPAVFSAGTSLGASQKFNRLEVSLAGSFDRTIYENARFSDGSTLDLASTDYNAFGGSARASYELTPDVKPFVEASLDRRVHDSLLDVFGFERDSHGLAFRGGSTFKFSELLEGEASGGYAERSYEDPRLPKLRGPTIDAALVYTPTPLTTLTLRSATNLNETTAIGAAGVFSHAFTAQLSHDLLRNLTLTAVATYLTNDYQGADIFEKGYTAGLRLDYSITRSIVMRGSYSHEKLHSTAPGGGYTADVFLVGLRLQR